MPPCAQSGLNRDNLACAMILIRRLITVPLGLVFFLLMVAAVLLLAVNERFLQTNAYPELLAETEFYAFVMGPLLTTALDEARELPGSEFSDDFSDNPFVLSGLTTEEISASLNRAFPPEWTQELVDTSFDQIGGYIRGEQDEFTVQIEAGEQVKIIVDEAQALLSKAQAYNLLYDEVVDPLLEEFDQGGLPLDVSVPVSSLSAAARAIIPPDWIQDNVEGILDEVTPYMVGDTESFRVHIPFDDRVEIAAEELKKLLAEGDVYQVVYDEVIEPAVTDALGVVINLPIGISISKDEVVAAMRAVAPISWVQQQAEQIIDAAVPYLVGREDDFVVSLDLRENKVATAEHISLLVATKLEALLNLPTCTQRQLVDLLTISGFSDIPECIPPGMPIAELAELVSEGIDDQIQALVIDAIPDTVEFDQSTLLSQVASSGDGEDSIERLNDIRELLADGFTYTDADLKADIVDIVDNDIMSLDGFEDFRSFLSEGWSFTEQDLEARVDQATGGIETFHTIRENFNWVNTFRWLVFLPMGFILLLIGMLGGRSWRSRLAWAGAFLTVGAAITFAISGPVYDSQGKPRLDDLKEEIRQEIQLDDIYFLKTSELATEKALEIAEVVADDFRNSMFAGSRNLLIAGVAILAVAIGLGFLPGGTRKRKRRPVAKSAGAGKTDYSDVFREAKQESDAAADDDDDDDDDDRESPVQGGLAP